MLVVCSSLLPPEYRGEGTGRRQVDDAVWEAVPINDGSYEERASVLLCFGWWYLEAVTVVIHLPLYDVLCGEAIIRCWSDLPSVSCRSQEGLSRECWDKTSGYFK